MPAKGQEPPVTALALLDKVLGSRDRTRHAVILVVTGGVVLALVLAAVLVVVSLFGVTGTAITGGAGVLASAGVIARRRRQRRS